MSKIGTARSRAEKTRGPTLTAVQAVTNDIVAGKYNEYDWNLLLEKDANDEFIWSLVNGIITDTEKVIHGKYLNSCIVPYTVDLAKSAFINIIAWNFLHHEKDNADNCQLFCIEDEEPESCTIDSWAQGYFPKRQATVDLFCHPTEVTMSSLEEMRMEGSEGEIDEAQLKESVEDLVVENESFQKFEELYDTGGDFTKEEIVDEEMDEVVVSCNIVEQTTKKKNKVFKPYRGKINYGDLSLLTETLLETELRLAKERKMHENKLTKSNSSLSASSRQLDDKNCEKKVIQKLFGTSVKNWQDLQPSDIFQFTNSQLVSIMKVPAEQLLPQKVKASHRIMEVSMKKKQDGSNKETGSKKSITEGALTGQKDNDRNLMNENDKHPLPVSMLDSIDPVPGVWVQEGERIKKSVTKKQEKTRSLEKELSYLKPVKSHSTESSYLIDDIINVHMVQVKPLTTVPVPPIRKH